jgi:uncharacterized protein
VSFALSAIFACLIIFMLYLRKSLLPGAGKGLFTDSDIPKGTEIVEYRGELIPWSTAEERIAKGYEGYVFYISDKLCIDAYFTPKELARYANDAKGFGRVDGLRNNSQYIIKRRDGTRKVFIVASRTIKAGSEILVDYGNDYWRYLRKKPRKKPGKKAKRVASRKKK